jgi:nicotinamide mononucleotide transporter
MSALSGQLAADLAATTWLEWLAVVTGVIYVVLIARQRRGGWISGGISSSLYVYIAWHARLPLQAGLQLFYVLMAVYGWYSWTRAAGVAAPRVSSWPLRRHLFSVAAILIAGLLVARTLAVESNSAWPRLDSLTTVASLLATWLVVRSVLENWLYWIAVDAISAYMFYLQGHPLTAMLFLTFLSVAIAGYFSWRRQYRALQR